MCSLKKRLYGILFVPTVIIFFVPHSVPRFPEWPLWKSPVCAAGVSLTDARVHVRVHVRVHAIDGQRERVPNNGFLVLPQLTSGPLIFCFGGSPPPRRDEVLGSPARIPFFHHQPSLEKVASAQLIPASHLGANRVF